MNKHKQLQRVVEPIGLSDNSDEATMQKILSLINRHQHEKPSIHHTLLRIYWLLDKHLMNKQDRQPSSSYVTSAELHSTNFPACKTHNTRKIISIWRNDCPISIQSVQINHFLLLHLIPNTRHSSCQANLPLPITRLSQPTKFSLFIYYFGLLPM